MPKYGYNQEKCDQLRRDRKNLTNKLYRRRVKKKKLPPDSPEIENINSDISKIKSKITSLNNQIWRCTEQYSNLKSEERSIKGKLYYRKKKLEKLPRDSREAKETREEMRQLRSKLEQVDEKLFIGSPRYKTMEYNFSRLDKEIERLQKYRIDNYDSMTENNRLRLIDRIKELGDKKRMLQEVIEGREIRFDVRDRVKFRVDPETKIEYYEFTIYEYKDQLDNILARKRYNKVIIEGKEFDYPQQLMEIEFACSMLDAEYSENGSGIIVQITADNKNKIVTVDVETFLASKNGL